MNEMMVDATGKKKCQEQDAGKSTTAASPKVSECRVSQCPNQVGGHDTMWVFSRYKEGQVSRASGILFLNRFSSAIFWQEILLRETRPWSASGGHGELSHHALGDRHEGGAEPGGGRGTIGFRRIDLAQLVSVLYFRPAALVFAGRRSGSNRREVRAGAGAQGAYPCSPAQG